MNAYVWIILVALIGEWGLEFIADVLNLRAFPESVPDEFADAYTAEDHRKSRAYARQTTVFSWIRSGVGLTALLLFWLLGGFVRLDSVIREMTRGTLLDNDICRGILFFTALIVIKKMLSIPFELYDTFVIEERFGFNRTKLGTFIGDNIKALILGIILGWPLLGLVIWFFQTAGSEAWILCWVVVVAFSLALQYIAPTWIMPLFNTFTPLRDGPLKDRICAFAERVGFPLAGVYVIDGSRRTNKSNAFFTGFGRNKRIALYDTLLNRHTDDELLAVLAHEIGHYKKRHIMLRMAAGIVQAGVTLALLQFFLGSQALFAAFGFETQPVYAGLVFFSLLFSPVNLVLGMVLNAWSRAMEFEADRFAVRHTRDRAALAEALKRLSKDSLAEIAPHPLHVFLHYSHPPILQRLAALKRVKVY